MRCVVLAVLPPSSPAFGQTPQPFPRPGEQPRTQRPADPPVNTGSAAPPPASKPSAQAGAHSPAPTPSAATQKPADPNAPAAAVVWFPIYPSAQFIASYDAGRSQRYYIFGSTAAFAELVTYYRTVLKDKGDLVFQDPPTHMLEVGKFNNDTMAFPPGVTIKDFASGGSQGYANPKPGAQPARFPSLIMIVPAPPGAAR